MKSESRDDSYKHIEYLSERARRMAEAVYRVTNLFSDEEPLKWALRKDALLILTEALSLGNKSSNKNTGSAESILDNISRITHILELASAGTFITRINFEVLKREYSILSSFVEEKKVKFLPFFSDFETRLLEKGDLENAAKTAEGKKLEDKARRKPVKGQSKGHFNGHNENHKGHLDSKQLAEERDSLINKKSYFNYGHKKGHTVRESASAKERKNKILEFIKDKGWINVKDILLIFENISEKTLQRDLLRMFDKGLLKKEGDKRWRRYAFFEGENQ